MKSVFISLSFLCLAVSGVHAQALILKDGSRVNAGQFSIEDGKIMQTKAIGTAGQTAKIAVAITSIDRMEWPEVKEVLESQTLLSEGKSKEAAEGLIKAKEFFKPLKAVKGSPYPQVSFALVEVLDQAGDFDTLLRTLPEVEEMKWDDAHQLKLRIIKLNMDRRTSSDQEGILAQAERLLLDTDDAAVCARLWMTIAEIHAKKERWEPAFDSYLHVPVFYGSQGALVPQAELAAARILVKMERFKDATGFYQRIMEQYGGSEIGNTAKAEMLPINGQPNKPDKVPIVGADSKKEAEKK